MTSDVNRDAIRRCFEIVSSGADGRAAEVVTEDYVNHESGRQPPDCQVPGPAGFAAAIRWLNSIFSDLEFDIAEHRMTQDDLALFTQLDGQSETGLDA